MTTHRFHRWADCFYLALAAATLAGWFSGCGAPPIKPVLTDSDPSVKIPAIELAVQQKDRSAIPILIKALDSEDPAVRFYASDALQKLTGEGFGYLYYADDEVRRPAVVKWQKWSASQAGLSSRQSTQP